MPFVTDYLWQLCSNFLRCHKRLFVAKYQHIVANLVATKTNFSCSAHTPLTNYNIIRNKLKLSNFRHMFNVIEFIAILFEWTIYTPFPLYLCWPSFDLMKFCIYYLFPWSTSFPLYEKPRPSYFSFFSSSLF